MKPTAYIKFYGLDFFHAVEAHDDTVGMAYLRAIWYYVRQTHCEGLENDTEQLRRICRLDSSNAERVLGIVFGSGEFFCLGEDAKWHQKRAAAEYAEALAAYNKKLKLAAGMNRKRWGK